MKTETVTLLLFMLQQAVKLLVDKGADLSEKDKEGLTALINAAEVSMHREKTTVDASNSFC